MTPRTYGPRREPGVERVEGVPRTERLDRAGRQVRHAVGAALVELDLDAELEPRQPDRIRQT